MGRLTRGGNKHHFEHEQWQKYRGGARLAPTDLSWQYYPLQTGETKVSILPSRPVKFRPAPTGKMVWLFPLSAWIVVGERYPTYDRLASTQQQVR